MESNKHETLNKGNYSRIWFSKNWFRRALKSTENYGDLVLSIYHEFVHVELFHGLNNKPLTHGNEQHELLAHYYTFVTYNTFKSKFTRMSVVNITFQIQNANDNYRDYYRRNPDGALQLSSYLIYINNQCPPESGSKK